MLYLGDQAIQELGIIVEFCLKNAEILQVYQYLLILFRVLKAAAFFST